MTFSDWMEAAGEKGNVYRLLGAIRDKKCAVEAGEDTEGATQTPEKGG